MGALNSSPTAVDSSSTIPSRPSPRPQIQSNPTKSVDFHQSNHHHGFKSRLDRSPEGTPERHRPVLVVGDASLVHFYIFRAQFVTLTQIVNFEGQVRVSRLQ